MAGHQANRPAASSIRLARLGALSLALAALLPAACRRGEFRLSGTITIASNLQHKAPRDNAVLFIVAKNLGGVPMAVQRVVNPQFPVKFSLGPDDLLMPDLPTETPLNIEVEMNTHGALGSPQHGDLAGRHPSPVHPGDRWVHIVVDRQL